ncbi:DUF4136 domain-containing protein [Salinimicrobium tongyeongense]|uniref:DUF4136 domain-containing protein n=1 Tax=Salinimicrobium tongyeongense TaxID=2809707 RepID=A0ABY6NN35_9FLAO|nr:DUF4136 domain-containing protein [Salinimicrobium tongyeongense]UZH54305.1 DUF4136 domain-containing protein [Salinimicrobium tongyeongense]
MRFLKIFCLCAMISACGGPRAAYDYDDQINFSNYNSIGIYPEMRTGLSELDENRLLNSVKNAIKERGLSASTTPNLYLNIYSEQYQEPSRNRLGVGIGGTGGNVGVGVSGGIPLGGPESFLQLTFDLIDVQRDELVWQAVVNSKFDFNWSPSKRQQQFDKIVNEALEGYPPKR